MRKRYSVIGIIGVLLTGLSASGQSPDGVLLESLIFPESKYLQTIEKSFKNDITAVGPEEVLNGLNSSGFKNPTLTESHTTTELVTTSGKLSADSILPFLIEYVRTTGTAGYEECPDGTLMYGHSSNDKGPILDSIVSAALSDSAKAAILLQKQSTFSSTSYPKERIHIGETKSTTTPISMPIPGGILEMNMTTSYNLIAIDNGIAHFEIAISGSLKSNHSDKQMTATCTGKGTLDYAIDSSNCIEMKVDSEMRITITKDELTLKVTTKYGHYQTSKITKH